MTEKFSIEATPHFSLRIEIPAIEAFGFETDVWTVTIG